jgi:toxin ParE1/3/4
MVLQIRWRGSARRKLDAIFEFVSADSPVAARALRDRIQQAVIPASDHPEMFRPGRVPGTREIVAHPNYIVVYRIMADHIEVVSVIHSRQEYP